MAMDLTHVNAALALKGESESQAAVIDYASSSLFLKP